MIPPSVRATLLSRVLRFSVLCRSYAAAPHRKSALHDSISPCRTHFPAEHDAALQSRHEIALLEQIGFGQVPELCTPPGKHMDVTSVYMCEQQLIDHPLCGWDVGDQEIHSLHLFLHECVRHVLVGTLAVRHASEPQ
jgi:hypothetical protein